MKGIERIRQWLAGSYEERHVEIHVECTDRYGDEENDGPTFITVVMLSEIAHTGPSEPSSTGDHSQSIIQHFGTGVDLDEAVDQALAQWTAVKGTGFE